MKSTFIKTAQKPLAEHLRESIKTPVLTSTSLIGLCLEEMNFHYHNIQVQHASYVPSKVCVV